MSSISRRFLVLKSPSGSLVLRIVLRATHGTMLTAGVLLICLSVLSVHGQDLFVSYSTSFMNYSAEHDFIWLIRKLADLFSPVILSFQDCKNFFCSSFIWWYASHLHLSYIGLSSQLQLQLKIEFQLKTFFCLLVFILILLFIFIDFNFL